MQQGARGFTLGYREGAKGSVWLTRLIDGKGRREVALGPADDALDADGKCTTSAGRNTLGETRAA